MAHCNKIRLITSGCECEEANKTELSVHMGTIVISNSRKQI